jgi:drug/metabolite transporter (DMT)-like permease
MPYLLFIFIAFIWGSSFVLMGKAKEAFGSSTIACWRLLLGGAVLWAVWRITRRGEPWPKIKGHFFPLLMIAVGGYAVPYVIQPYFIAKTGSSALMGIFMSLLPLLTILVSIPMLGIRPTVRQILGVVGGFICLIKLLSVTTDHPIALYDELLAASVPFTYAIANTYVKKRFHDRPPLALSADALAIGGVVMLPISLCLDPIHLDHVELALTAVFILGVGSTGLAAWAFYKLVQKHGPLYPGMVAYVIPLVAVGWGYFFDGKQLTAGQLVAMAGILVMVALVQTEKAVPAPPAST